MIAQAPVLRAATGADLDPLWSLRTRAILRHCTAAYGADVVAAWAGASLPASYPRWVAAGGALVAHDGERLLGYAILDVPGGEVEAMFVEPGDGGRGIGRLLLAALEDMASARGLQCLRLSASLNAVPFYARCGFAQGPEDVYHHPCGVDLRCVRMDKRLAGSNP